MSIHLMCALVLVATPLFGQVPTGRQRPVVATTDEPRREAFTSDRPWFFSAGIGVIASGHLWKVDSDDIAGYWVTPDGSRFYSSHFVIMLDEDIDLAVALGRRLGERAWVRLSLSTAQMNMRARARIGQGGGFFRWDQMSIVLLGLELEYRLIMQPRTPYLLAGAGTIDIRGSKDASVDQTRPVFRFGGGYHLQVNRVFGLRAEIRNSLSSLDFSDFLPSVFFPQDLEEQPVISINESTAHNIWEILVKIQGQF